MQKAIEVATKTQKTWDSVPFEERIKIWMRAADLMANKYRWKLNAATMLGQAKTVVQAEIDSAAELIDFIRYGRQNTLLWRRSLHVVHLRGFGL